MSASSSVGQRFSQLIQQLGMSKNAFAMSLDKTATVIQHLVDERNKPGFDLMNKVIEVYPNVSVDWLLLGQGPMLRDSSATPVAIAAPPVATPAATASPRVAPVTPGFPEPLFTVSAASQPSAEAPALPAEPVVAAPPAETAAAPPATATQPLPTPALAEVPQPLPVAQPLVPAPATPPAAPDAAYLTAALHAQYLQHQLALAEQRNQHLMEQQQLMQQMLTMLQSR